ARPPRRGRTGRGLRRDHHGRPRGALAGGAGPGGGGPSGWLPRAGLRGPARPRRPRGRLHGRHRGGIPPRLPGPPPPPHDEPPAAKGRASPRPTTTVVGHEQLLAVRALCRRSRGEDPGGSRVLGAHFYGPYFGREAAGCHPAAPLRPPEPAEYEQYLAFADSI